jgi:hypothetical protein
MVLNFAHSGRETTSDRDASHRGNIVALRVAPTYRSRE